MYFSVVMERDTSYSRRKKTNQLRLVSRKPKAVQEKPFSIVPGKKYDDVVKVSVTSYDKGEVRVQIPLEGPAVNSSTR
jgi:hypothetical protein